MAASPSVLFPANQCLFCNKNTIKINQVKHSLVTCSTEKAEASIKQAALDKDDEEILRKVRDQDLRAREAGITIAVRESILEAAPDT